MADDVGSPYMVIYGEGVGHHSIYGSLMGEVDGHLFTPPPPL